MCKSRVYDAIQSVAERVPGLKREQVFAGLKTPALGGDLTSVKVNGQWLTLGLTVDDISGLVLAIDDLTGEDAETLKEWMEPIVQAVGAQILVTDDADPFKTVADELGLDQHVCKGHVKRNTEALVDKSPRGTFILAQESSHYLYVDVPDLVLGAIRQTVEQARG